VLRDYRTLKVK